MSDTVLTAWWESKLGRRLHFVAGAAATVMLYRVALEEDLSWVHWAIISTAVILLVVTRWPYGALVLLTGASAMPVFFVELFGWKARPEHFAAAMVSFAAGVWFLFNKRSVRLQKLDYCILAYVALNYVSSAFTSPAPSDTLRWALLHNLAVLPYFLVRLLVQDLETLRKAVQILVSVGIVESAYGVLCYVSHHGFGTATGMESGQYLGDVAALYGSLYEPNLFGAYTACFAVFFLALYTAQGQSRLRNLICFFIASLAAALSLSRAALLALVVVIVWVLRKEGHPVKAGRNKLAIFTIGSGLILLIAFTAVRGVLQERFTNLFQQGLAEETTITRLIVVEEALRDIPSHPLLGSGTASFNLTFDWAKYVPEWGASKTWIGNAPLRILHDAGLFGLSVILGFFFLVWRKIQRGLHRSNSQFAMLLGLFAGTLVYCICFQSTDGSNLAFFWVQLGFLASAAILISDSNHDANGVGATAHRSA